MQRSVRVADRWCVRPAQELLVVPSRSQPILPLVCGFTLSFSDAGGCSLAPLSKVSQVKELVRFSNGPVFTVHSVAGATKDAEHP